MTTQAQKQTVGIGKFVQAGLIGGVIATIINLVLYFLGNAINGGPMLVKPPGIATIQAVPWFMVIVQSVLAGVIAGALYGLLARFTTRASTIFLGIAAVIFILFFFNPLLAAQNVTTIVVLEIMHLVVAALVIWRILSAARN
jgi:Family of unknown function (DUF6069)